MAGRRTELARKHGIHANTIRLWRDKYAGMESSDLVRMKQLEAENSQMRRIITRQALEIDAVKSPAHVDRKHFAGGVRAAESSRLMSNQQPSTKVGQLQPFSY